jgi:hypothetical protein
VDKPYSVNKFDLNRIFCHVSLQYRQIQIWPLHREYFSATCDYDCGSRCSVDHAEAPCDGKVAGRRAIPPFPKLSYCSSSQAECPLRAYRSGKVQHCSLKQIQAELLHSQPGFQAIRLGGRDDRSHHQHQESWVSLWECTSSPLLLLN